MTFVAALLLALAHFAQPSGPAASDRLRSFAGGVGVAYVFVIVLPLLSTWQGAVLEEMEVDRLVFLVALLGLSTYYALDLWATRLDRQARGNAAGAVHLAGGTFYALAVGFVLADYGERGVVWLFAYTAVLGLHFFMSARVRPRDDRLSRIQRGILAGGVIVGWALGSWLPHHISIAAFLFAAMAGAMIIDVLAGELPRPDHGVPGWFLLGVAIIVLIAFGLRL